MTQKILDRREYTRFPVNNQKIIFYVEGNEYIGDILDVSEKGFKVKVSSENSDIPEQTKFSYQFYYSLEENNSDKTNYFIVNGHGYVVRNDIEDVVGCRVQSNEELNKFVRQIIIEIYKNK